MPTALLRPCPAGGGTCPELTEGGPCPAHATQREQRRGSAASRGYGRRWEAFKWSFISALSAAGITPACGASLPGGPHTKAYSRCAAEGRLEVRGLHLDHDPPLTDDERQHRRTVCDRARVGLLCPSCHARKTHVRGVVLMRTPPSRPARRDTALGRGRSRGTGGVWVAILPARHGCGPRPWFPRVTAK